MPAKIFFVIFFILLPIPGYTAASTSDPLTPEERAWVSQNTIRIPMGLNLPPYAFYDSDGRYVGLLVDLFSKMAEDLSLRIQQVPVKSFSEMMNLCGSGRLDALLGVHNTPGRSAFLNFTEPLIETPYVLVVRKSWTGSGELSDMAERQVGVVKNIFAEEILTRDYPELRIHTVPQNLTGLQQVSSGTLDTMVIQQGYATFLIEKERITNLKIAGNTGFSDALCIGVRKDNPVLFSIMKKASARVSKAEVQSLVRKWVWSGSDTRMFSRKFWIALAALLCSGLFATVMVITWNRALHRLVRERTRNLNEQNHLLSELLDAIPAPVFYKDQGGKYVGCNKAFQELIEQPAENIIGKSIFEVLPAHRIPKDIDAYHQKEQDLMTGRRTDFHELRLESDRFPTFLHIYRAVYSQLSGEPAGIVGAIFDVTELKQKERQLIQAQKMQGIGTLAGGISHDFNNILGVITGNIHLIRHQLQKRGTDGYQNLSRYTDNMERAAMMATELTQQLLSFSKDQPIQHQTVNLNQSIDNILRICKNTFDKSIRLSVTPFPEPARISGDPGQIEQVFLNLFVNAAQAMTLMQPEGMPQGGSLSISLHRIIADDHFTRMHPEASSGSYWHVAISDTGVGMTPEVKAQIFDPFFSTKAKNQGTGLGLATVFHIIQNHKGFISVYSTPGIGTTFNVYLPVSVEAETFTAEPEDTSVVRGSGRVLLVEDDPLLRMTARYMLETCGYTVETAANGNEAEACFTARAGETDVVIMDMIMPEKSGIEAFHAIREIRKDVPVIMTSGLSQNPRLTEMIRKEGLAFLAKPYAMLNLASIVHDTISEAKNDSEENKPHHS